MVNFLDSLQEIKSDMLKKQHDTKEKQNKVDTIKNKQDKLSAEFLNYIKDSDIKRIK